MGEGCPHQWCRFSLATLALNDATKPPAGILPLAAVYIEVRSLADLRVC